MSEIRFFWCCLKESNAIHNFLTSLLNTSPAFDSHPLAFIQILVVFEEVRYLTQQGFW